MQALDNHLRVHDGHRDFACDACDKKFVSHGALYSHRREATNGEKGSKTQSGQEHTVSIICITTFLPILKEIVVFN